MPYGANRKYPAPRSRRLPKTLGLSNRGTHNQSTEPSAATSAPVWQSERKAYSAIGGKGDGMAALCAFPGCLRSGIERLLALGGFSVHHCTPGGPRVASAA